MEVVFMSRMVKKNLAYCLALGASLPCRSPQILSEVRHFERRCAEVRVCFPRNIQRSRLVRKNMRDLRNHYNWSIRVAVLFFFHTWKWFLKILKHCYKMRRISVRQSINYTDVADSYNDSHSRSNAELHPLPPPPPPPPPFTPKSDQRQISPAASPQILHNTEWRTWLVIAYSDEVWLYYQFSLSHQYISL